MTSKELFYVEDALGHENFMQTCACATSKQLSDVELSKYVKQLESTHTGLLNKFLNLL